MSSQDLAATLQTYNNCILTTLLELRRSIAIKLNSTHAELARLTLQCNNIQSDLNTVEENIEATNKLLLSLDTLDLEVLEVQGQTEFHHQCKGLRKPDFHFDLRTQFPIRNYSVIQVKESVWKTQVCEIGGYTFKGEVRTKAFKNGHAKVMLYGYRRDVMASAINGLKESLGALKGPRRLHSSRLEDTKTEIRKLEVVKANLLSELDNCRKDLQSVTLLASINDTSAPGIFLRDRSIAGLAAHHGLTLTMTKEDSVPDQSQATTWLFRAFESELSSALTYLKDMKENYVNANLNLRKSSSGLPGRLEDLDRNTKCPELAAVCREISALTARNTSSRVLDLSRVATREVRSLALNLQDALSLLKTEMEAIEPVTTIQSSIHILGDLCHRIELTEKELAACKASVAAVKDGRYIGVIASRKMAPTTTEAWMDVYRGVKAGVVNHAWTMFPPDQGGLSRTTALLQSSKGLSARKPITGVSS